MQQRATLLLRFSIGLLFGLLFFSMRSNDKCANQESLEFSNSEKRQPAVGNYAYVTLVTAEDYCVGIVDL